MGKFVVHGTILEEPIRKTLNSGMDCVTIIIEESVVNSTSLKEAVNTYSVDFMGKASRCIPEGVRIANCAAVIMGDISSRLYNGKYYNDLRGKQFSLISGQSLKQASGGEEPKTPYEDNIELPEEVEPDDDLPF